MQNQIQVAAIAKTRGTSFEYLPVGLFGSVMGMTGLSVAWHLAHDRFGVSRLWSDGIGAAAVLVFLLVAGGYVAKLVTAPEAVRAEFAHPIAGNLFGTILISLLLLPIILAKLDLTLARTVWAVGALGMTAFWTCRWRCRLSDCKRCTT